MLGEELIVAGSMAKQGIDRTDLYLGYFAVSSSLTDSRVNVS